MFFVFYFIKISKFALPGVMLMYERTSKDRKKERKKERVDYLRDNTVKGLLITITAYINFCTVTFLNNNF